jgi:hypothetical protein
LTQSPPTAGGAGVKVGSGVGVSGAGVEVGSPAGTVCVGTGVSAMVAVGGGVHVGNGVGWAAGRLAKTVINVTMIVPATPINAARTVESSVFFSFDIFALPLCQDFKLFQFYARLNVHSRAARVCQHIRDLAIDPPHWIPTQVSQGDPFQIPNVRRDLCFTFIDMD